MTKNTLKRLQKIFDDSYQLKISDNDKILILSDMHIGNGGRFDDFNQNSEIVKYILREYYLKNDYTLILNGDIEELYKFPLKKIENYWNDLFNIFDLFQKSNKLYKIVGNHDFELLRTYKNKQKYNLFNAINLEYNNNSIFIYHGHQTANILEQYSKLILYIIRYIFRTVSNQSVSIFIDKKYKTEEIAYNFSVAHKIISILGHTHRPLFESASKIETLKMIIETLIRKYKYADTEKQKKIELLLKKHKEELSRLYSYNKQYHERSSIYNSELLVPCLFNSGAVVGKHGLTGIEIKNGKIYLIYWFDVNRSQRYIDYKGVKTRQLNDSNYFKAVLKKESLDYIFNRIKLLL